MKIGVTTYYNYNYGSALQCYALQKYIETNFDECVLINKKNSSNLLKRLIYLVGKIGFLCLKNPTSTSDILKIFLSQRAKNLRISKDSLIEIQRFLRYNIKKESYTWKMLCQIAKSDEYEAFITGSDQVWNGCRIDNQDFYFLRFAPSSKRIAYAPSFGGNAVAKYNIKNYKKYLKEFRALSSREIAGKNIIESLTGENVEVLCDPVCLFDSQSWREQYNSGTLENIDLDKTKYVFAFFIDRPSQKSIDAIKELQRQSGFCIYSLGYKYDSFKILNEYEHFDGSPWLFLKMIDKAEVVVTDSFHATMFSLIFSKKFYVFKRCYIHRQDQSERIINLLNKVDRISEFEPETVDINYKKDTDNIKAYFEKSRSDAYSFLNSVLEKKNIKEKKQYDIINLAFDKNLCCGCGACVEACPRNAIKMRLDSIGAEYPIIDNKLCIKCNKCVNICSFKKGNEFKSDFNKKFYVVNSNDKQLTKESSSAGMFAIMAKKTISKGGVVFGAAVCSEKDSLLVKHIAIEKENELYKIQGSKYVQSNTLGIFKEVEKALEAGKPVLFSGTSCQVAQLKHYLKKNYNNLLTIDLVCHGVPGKGILDEYRKFLEKKYNMSILNIRFRSKETKTPYAITIEGVTQKGKHKSKCVELNRSEYLRLFMWREGYRESCYYCPFATIDKPSDITLGDYYADENETEIIVNLGKKNLSFVMVNTSKGNDSFFECEQDINMKEISKEQTLKKHYNLKHASLPIKPQVMDIYLKKGFNGLSKYILKRNILTQIPLKIKKLIKK